MKLDDDEYSLLLTMKGGLLNHIIAGWVGRVGMPSKSFKPTIPDSQGQVSSNKN